MKRFVTILLVLAVLASMGSIAYAEESGSGSENFTEDGSSKTINIQGAFRILNFRRRTEPFVLRTTQTRMFM